MTLESAQQARRDGSELLAYLLGARVTARAQFGLLGGHRVEVLQLPQPFSLDVFLDRRRHASTLEPGPAGGEPLGDV